MTGDGYEWVVVSGARGALGSALASHFAGTGRRVPGLNRSFSADPPAAGVTARNLEALYGAAARLDRLTEVNALFLKALMRRLYIPTTVASDSDFAAQGQQTARTVDIVRKAGPTSYLLGPSARAYLDESLFAAVGVALEWMSYGPYRVYPQRGPIFDHAVSVIDLLSRRAPPPPVAAP